MKKIVPISNLKSGYVLEENIETRDGKVLVAKGYVLNEKIIASLKKWYAKSDCFISLDEDEVDDTLKVIEEKMIACLTDIYSGAKESIDKDLVILKSGVSSICKNLKDLDDIPKEIIKEHNFNTKVNHYFRVAQMAVVLANLYNKEIADDKKVSLKTVCMAALLHEYGMKFKDDVVIKKKAEIIFSQEFSDIPINSSHHTALAFVALENKVYEDVRLTILGESIPFSELEKDFRPWVKAAQIIYLCDIYDTLLEIVLEKDLQSPFENVISSMEQLACNNFLDENLYYLFLKHIPVYTKGEKVLLSTGEYAVVVKKSETFPTKPIVLTLPPETSKQIDLSKVTNIIIRQIVCSEEDTFNEKKTLHEEKLKNTQVSNYADISSSQEEMFDLLKLDKIGNYDVSKSFGKGIFRRK